MITYQRSKSLPIVFVIGVLAAAGAAYWWWQSQQAADHDGVVLSSSAGQSAWSRASSGNADLVAQLKPPILADGRPADVSEDDWAVLTAVLAKQGLQKADAARVIGYLRYQRSFENWQGLDETKDAKQRHRVAQALMEELPERLSKGEFTQIESMLMGAVLIADIESDETKRNQMVDAWQAKINSIMPAMDDDTKVAALARETELKRRQATAYGDWQAQTDPALRTPAKLEQSLEDVRRAYNSGTF
jgi:hypothetical protein